MQADWSTASQGNPRDWIWIQKNDKQWLLITYFIPKLGKFAIPKLLRSQHLILLDLLLGVHVRLYEAVLHLWIELESTARLQVEFIQTPERVVSPHHHHTS